MISSQEKGTKWSKIFMWLFGGDRNITKLDWPFSFPWVIQESAFLLKNIFSGKQFWGIIQPSRNGIVSPPVLLHLNTTWLKRGAKVIIVSEWNFFYLYYLTSFIFFTKWYGHKFCSVTFVLLLFKYFLNCAPWYLWILSHAIYSVARSFVGKFVFYYVSFISCLLWMCICTE